MSYKKYYSYLQYKLIKEQQTLFNNNIFYLSRWSSSWGQQK